MQGSLTRIAVTILSLVALAACEQVKSASPLSPSIAGPIAGVQISSPGMVSPAAGASIASTEQPIVLVVDNSSSNGVRPLSYLFEIAVDSAFASKVFTQSGVTPGEGRTQLRLPQSLQAERQYYWRVKAQDGANEGEYSSAVDFTVYTPVLIGVPTLLSPADGVTVSTNKPTLEVNNAPVSGPAGAITYIFDVATDPTMGNHVAGTEVPAGNGRTSWTVQNDLTGATRYYWRVRAFDFGRIGDWSSIRTFVTPTPVVVAPPPVDSGGGGTGGPAPNDDININAVQFVGLDVSRWAVTSTITSAAHSGSDLCTSHTKAGRWPAIPWFGDPGSLVEGNQWFFANIGGKWIGGPNEWLRPGQVCKNIDGHVGDGGYGGTALEKWTPAAGEIVGVMVSTPARSGQWGTAERSNIVLIRW